MRRCALSKKSTFLLLTSWRAVQEREHGSTTSSAKTEPMKETRPYRWNPARIRSFNSKSFSCQVGIVSNPRAHATFSPPTRPAELSLLRKTRDLIKMTDMETAHKHFSRLILTQEYTFGSSGAASSNVDALVSHVRDAIMGENRLFTGPWGERKVTCR